MVLVTIFGTLNFIPYWLRECKIFFGEKSAGNAEIFTALFSIRFISWRTVLHDDPEKNGGYI